MVTIDVLLAEYDALKKEQTERIKARDNLTYATLVAISAAVAGAIQAKTPTLLLTIPAVCSVLGWTRLATDHKVTAIRDYLYEHLAPKMTSLLDEDDDVVLGWETVHRDDPRRSRRKALQLGADVLTFVAPSFAAVAAWSFLTPLRGVPAIAIGLASLILPGIFAWQIIDNADR